MNPNLTRYKVMQNHGTENQTTVCWGNLRQCWLYVLNTHAEDISAANLSQKGIVIMPDNDGGQYA